MRAVTPITETDAYSAKPQLPLLAAAYVSLPNFRYRRHPHLARQQVGREQMNCTILVPPQS